MSLSPQTTQKTGSMSRQERSVSEEVSLIPNLEDFSMLGYNQNQTQDLDLPSCNLSHRPMTSQKIKMRAEGTHGASRTFNALGEGAGKAMGDTSLLRARAFKKTR